MSQEEEIAEEGGEGVGLRKVVVQRLYSFLLLLNIQLKVILVLLYIIIFFVIQNCGVLQSYNLDWQVGLEYDF